jgi:ribonuclease D
VNEARPSTRRRQRTPVDRPKTEPPLPEATASRAPEADITAIATPVPVPAENGNKTAPQRAHALLSTTAELAEVCARLATERFVAVDTEFLRETTYWPKLCVIQLAGTVDVVLVDALAPGIDLAPFFELMANEAVVKVFHAARQDVEICVHRGGFVPKPLFDTQIAATVLGFGDQVSYDQLIQRLVGVEIDKSLRFTDWSRRPLTQAQLDYAAADVIHLRPAYERLVQRLEKRGRSQWVADEMALLGETKTYVTDPDDAWIRLRGRMRKPQQIAVLMEVAAWREREARARDVPRSRVLKDEAVQDVADKVPTSVEALGMLRTIPSGFERSRTGADILAAVQRGIERDMSTIPRFDDDRNGPGAPGALTDMLKVLAKKVCEEAGVAPKVLATVDEIEAVASDDNADVQALKGWRRELFGEKALRLKRGELSMAVENGRIVIEERVKKG